MPDFKQLTEVFNVDAVSHPFNSVLVSNLHVYTDFPREGVNFIDVFPIFRSKYLLSRIASAMKRAVDEVKSIESVTAVAAPESRGFTLGILLAQTLGVPFIPFRKPNKLPCPTVSQQYALEYGYDTLEFPKDVLTADDRVLIVDDLIAIGGTMKAMIDLIRNDTEATVHSALSLINLVDFPKPECGAPVTSLLYLKQK